MFGEKARVPDRIEMLMATPPEGEPVSKPRIAGTIVNRMMVSIFASAANAVNISEIPAASMVFLSRNAPYAAAVMP